MEPDTGMFRSIGLKPHVANIPETDEAKTVFTFGNMLPGSHTIQDIADEHFQGSLPPRRIHIEIKKPGK